MKKIVESVVKTTPAMLVPYHHDHRQVLVDDLKHLAEEVYRICQQHGIPCVMAMEAALTENGESMFSMKHFPKERMDKVGLTPRHLLACFALAAEPQDVQSAVVLLMKHKILT